MTLVLKTRSSGGTLQISGGNKRTQLPQSPSPSSNRSWISKRMMSSTISRGWRRILKYYLSRRESRAAKSVQLSPSLRWCGSTSNRPRAAISKSSRKWVRELREKAELEARVAVVTLTLLQALPSEQRPGWLESSAKSEEATQASPQPSLKQLKLSISQTCLPARLSSRIQVARTTTSPGGSF